MKEYCVCGHANYRHTPSKYNPLLVCADCDCDVWIDPNE